MPRFPALTDEQMSNVLCWRRARWEGHAGTSRNVASSEVGGGSGGCGGAGERGRGFWRRRAGAMAQAGQSEAGRGFYRVKPGDTLYGIARAQKQRPSDLIKWNNLPESKQVNIDQLLRVAPPGSTPSGTTAASTDDWSKQASSAAGSKSGPPIIGAPAATAHNTSAPDTSTPAINSKGAWLAWPAPGD